MFTLYTVYCHLCRCAASALAIRCQQMTNCLSVLFHLEWSWTGCDPESSSIHHIKKTLVGLHVSSTAINRRATASCVLQRWNQSWTSVALVYCLISVLTTTRVTGVISLGLCPTGKRSLRIVDRDRKRSARDVSFLDRCYFQSISQLETRGASWLKNVQISCFRAKCVRIEANGKFRQKAVLRSVMNRSSLTFFVHFFFLQ